MEEDDSIDTVPDHLKNKTKSHSDAYNQEPMESVTVPSLNCVEYVCRGAVNINLNDEKPVCFKKSRKANFRRLVRTGRKVAKRTVARFVKTIRSFTQCR